MSKICCPDCLMERAKIVRLRSDGSCPSNGCKYRALWQCSACKAWSVYPITGEGDTPLCRECLNDHFEKILDRLEAGQVAKAVLRRAYTGKVDA